MKKILTVASIATLTATLISGHAFAGRGGRGGGGGARGGGGGISRGGGGGFSGGSAPSFNRPTATTRPAGGGSNLGGGRPSTLPSTRPNVGERPNVGTRPTQPTTRPNVGNVGDRTAVKNNVGISGRPTQLPAPGNRPGAESRADNRGNRLENRSDRVANRSETLENRHDMWHDIHDDWHHGNWHDHWHDIDHPWAAAGAIAALTPWSWGSYWYDVGYYPYYNPYYVPAQTTVVVQSPAVDYSQPIETTTTSSDAKPLVTDDALAEFDVARAAFYDGEYTKALAQVDKALAKMPSDTTMHEFRALVQFAMKKYKDSAATLYSVLSVAPPWDWTTMSGLYPSVDLYTQQLRTLEGYSKLNANTPEGHLVLGYHYMVAGHAEEAAAQFEQVVKLSPKDQVAQQLLQLVKPADEQPTPGPSKPADEKPPASVVGTWKASSGGDGAIQLAMKQDGSFTWNYTSKGKASEFSGKYQLAGNTLVLENQQGAPMVGKVTAKGLGFHFQMLGSPSSDPGLDFQKD